MRNTLVFIAACACVHWATAQVHVRPHVTKDGTYVQGHTRTAPNSTKVDNYSTQGNVNPYNGQAGTVNPYTPAQMPRQQVCGYVNGQYVCR